MHMSSLIPFSNRNLIDELFRDVSPGFFIRPLHGEPLPTQIKVDIKEGDSDYVVHADIPGSSKENIHVNIEGDVVTIRAEISQSDTQRTDDKKIRTERYYGEVSRSFQLPVDIDQASSKARYENGVLTLTLTKSAQKTGQRLAIE
jgi:HSP20 family protein